MCPAEIAPLLEENRRAAYKVAARYLPNQDDVDEVVQEAAIKAVLNCHKYNDHYNFNTWWLTIVRRCALTRVRYDGCRPKPCCLDEAKNLHAQTGSPVAMLAQILEERWDIALSSLPRKQELAIRIICASGESPSLSSMRSCYYKGIRTLKGGLTHALFAP